MKKMKKFVAFVLCLAMILALAGCGGSSAYGNTSSSAAPAASSTAPAVDIKEDAIILRLANDVTEDHPKGQALIKFKEYVEKESNGALTIEMYWNNVLGGAAAYSDQLINGSIEMAIAGTELSERIPAIAAFEAPFLFKDWAAVQKFTDSDYAAHLFDELPQQHGIRVMSYVPQGFREIASNKEIRSMADFNGLRLRVPQINLYIAMGEDLGANPISMALTELYTAIEQDTVDALENTWAYLNSAKYYEVTKYLIETNHNFCLQLFFMNENTWNSLDPAYQEILTKGAAQFEADCYQFFQENESVARENIEAHGVEVITPDDAFRADIAASQTTSYDALYSTYPGTDKVIAEIRNIIGG